jgi:hypothetical protein
MKQNIDYIIQLMRDHTLTSDKEEFGEQDSSGGGSAAGGGGGSSTGYPTVTKWESGVTRGPANQIGLTKWKDIVKINRGKANTLL